MSVEQKNYATAYLRRLGWKIERIGRGDWLASELGKARRFHWKSLRDSISIINEILAERKREAIP